MATLSLNDIEIDVGTYIPNHSIPSTTPHTHHDSRHAVKCFRHCSSEFVFCFELPDFCPICKQDMLCSEMAVPPFISAILVKPSRGKSFLNDYKDGDSLHCGLLDEDGITHDFDEKGLHVSTKWLNCIYIPLSVTSSTKPLKRHIVEAKGLWSRQHQRYDSLSANCYTFLLFVLHHTGLYNGVGEEQFIEEVIIPRTTSAAKYISIYRRVSSGGGVYVKPNTE